MPAGQLGALTEHLKPHTWFSHEAETPSAVGQSPGVVHGGRHPFVEPGHREPMIGHCAADVHLP